MVLATIWEFLKKIPGWVWLVVAGALVGFTYVQQEKARVRRETNEKHEREALKEMGRVSDARVKANQENQNAADRADEAVRTMPRHLPDELRDEAPDIADIVLGPRRDGT